MECDMEEKPVPHEALCSIARNCVIKPYILAARLGILESEAEQIYHAHQSDLHEQLYQLLLKWKQYNPLGTWGQLKEAMDSGLAPVMRSMSRDNSHVTTPSPLDERRRVGLDSGDNNGRTECFREEEEEEMTGVQPSAPPPVYLFNEEQVSSGSGRSEESTVPSAPPYPFQFETAYVSCHGDTNVSDEMLTFDDLADVLELIHYENNWYDLGLMLRVPVHILEEIQQSNARQVADCRRELVKVWLKQRGTMRPSWRALCQALRKPMIGNNELANKIGRVHRIM